MDALRTEIEARERCVENVIHGKGSATKEERRVHRPPPTTSVSYTAERRDIGSTPLPCIFCKRQHKMSACQTVESISARRNVLRREGRCYICLKRVQIVASCRSQNRCFKCKGNHHSAICHKQIFEERKKESETEIQPKTPEKTTNLRADTTNSMLLQTAQVLICHPAGEKKVIRARAIFDSGSQQSYIL